MEPRGVGSLMRRPPPGTLLNRGHSLAAGLAFFSAPDGIASRDQISGLYGANTSGSNIATTDGPAWRSSASNNNASSQAWATANSIILSGPFSSLLRVKRANTATQSSYDRLAGNINFPTRGLCWIFSGAADADQGKLYFFWYSSGTGYFTTVSQNTVVSATEFNTFVVTYDGASVIQYGPLGHAAGVTAVAGGHYPGTLVDKLGIGASPPEGASGAAVDVSMFAIWKDRALSPGEAGSLILNPFQLFGSLVRRTYFFPSLLANKTPIWHLLKMAA